MTLNTSLRVFLILAIVIYLLIIVHLLRKNKLNLRYTLVWLASAVVMAVIAIFPQIVYFIAGIIGIVDITNVVFVIEGMFVLLILLSLTSIVSGLNDKNRSLVQEVALLEKRVRELEEKLEENNNADV